VNAFWVNLGLALLWSFLSPKPSLTTFATGFVLGFAVVAVGRRLFADSDYIGKVWAIVGFLWAFGCEFLLSNLALIRVVLFRRCDQIRPGFLTYDISVLSPVEVQILTHCISLTPGTTTVDVLEDGRTLLLHALDAGNPEMIRRSIDRRLREPLLRCTRS